MLNGGKDYLLGRKLGGLGLLMWRRGRKCLGIGSIWPGLVPLMWGLGGWLLRVVRMVRSWCGMLGLMPLRIGFRGINRKFVGSSGPLIIVCLLPVAMITAFLFGNLK